MDTKFENSRNISEFGKKKKIACLNLRRIITLCIKCCRFVLVSNSEVQHCVIKAYTCIFDAHWPRVIESRACRSEEVNLKMEGVKFTPNLFLLNY